MSRKIPVLTYHSTQVDGSDYATNDHVALREDLSVLSAEGFRIVPASWVAEWVTGRRADSDMESAVAITFDDGCTMDFRDMCHPVWGDQRGFYGILEDFRRRADGSQPTVHATAFVIGSPDTRADLAPDLAGPEWISDDWWAEAAASGRLAVENHSWDHNHPASRTVCQRAGVRGRLDNIETFAECDAEVTRAADFIAAKAGARPTLFAYPWGQASQYMRDEYFPRHRDRHGCVAAFTAHDGFVTRHSNVWALPRLVFRANWSDQRAFLALLTESRRTWV